MSGADTAAQNSAEWDEFTAREILGKLVIVGVTYLTSREVFQSQVQMFGRIVAVDQVAGVTIELEGSRSGETVVFPPALDVFELAAPGEYRLRSTGEIVANPDYTCSWTSILRERQ